MTESTGSMWSLKKNFKKPIISLIIWLRAFSFLPPKKKGNVKKLYKKWAKNIKNRICLVTFSFFCWSQIFACCCLNVYNPFIQNPSGQVRFRIHNSLHFEQVVWGIYWMLWNISTEFGAIPIIKPNGSSSGEMNEVHEVVWIKIIIISRQFMSGFAIKWIMAPNLDRKKKHLSSQSFLDKGLWICDVSDKPIPTSWSPQICSHASASAPGWGHHRPPQNRGPGGRSPAVTGLSMRTLWEINIEITTVNYFY